MAVEIEEWVKHYNYNLELAFDEPLTIEPSSDTPTFPSLYTDSIAVEKGIHCYGAVQVEIAVFRATKDSYRALGITMIQSLFNDEKQNFSIALAKSSEVSRLVIESRFEASRRNPYGLHQKPTRFVYAAENPSEFPWHDRRLENSDLPNIQFDDQISPLIEGSAETLRGFGSAQALANFAALLLDISQPSNDVYEFSLEAYPGVQAVANESAEILLLLPESPAF